MLRAIDELPIVLSAVTILVDVCKRESKEVLPFVRFYLIINYLAENFLVT